MGDLLGCIHAVKNFIPAKAFFYYEKDQKTGGIFFAGNRIARRILESKTFQTRCKKYGISIDLDTHSMEYAR